VKFKQKARQPGARLVAEYELRLALRGLAFVSAVATTAVVFHHIFLHLVELGLLIVVQHFLDTADGILVHLFHLRATIGLGGVLVVLRHLLHLVVLVLKDGPDLLLLVVGEIELLGEHLQVLVGITHATHGAVTAVAMAFLVVFIGGLVLREGKWDHGDRQEHYPEFCELHVSVLLRK
jgi:hypothetical protein